MWEDFGEARIRKRCLVEGETQKASCSLAVVPPAVLSLSLSPLVVACPVSPVVVTPGLPDVEPAPDVAGVGGAVVGRDEDGDEADEAVELPSVLGIALVLVPASTAELLSVDVLVLADGSGVGVGADGDGGDVDEEDDTAALLLLGALVLAVVLLVVSGAVEALLVGVLLLLAAPGQTRARGPQQASTDKAG